MKEPIGKTTLAAAMAQTEAKRVNGTDSGGAVIDAAIAADHGAAVDETQPLPVLEIIIASRITKLTPPLHHIKVWADGRIDGLKNLADGQPVLVVNNLPAWIAQAVQPFRDLANDTMDSVDELQRSVERMGNKAADQEPTGG